MNYRDLQNISNLSQQILVEGANEEHSVLNRWPYTSPYLQESTEVDEGYKDLGDKARDKGHQLLNKSKKTATRGNMYAGTLPSNTPEGEKLQQRASQQFAVSAFHNPEKSQAKSAANKARGEGKKKAFSNRLTRSDKQGIKDSYDLYDIILSHLLDEGYAETQEQAEVIMVNMSEEWRQSIIEAVDDTHSGHPNYKGPSQDPLSRANRAIGNAVNFAMGQQGAEVRAKQKGIPGNVFVKQSGPFSTKNVPTKGSFISDTEMRRRGQSTKPMGPISQYNNF